MSIDKLRGEQSRRHSQEGDLITRPSVHAPPTDKPLTHHSKGPTRRVWTQVQEDVSLRAPVKHRESLHHQLNVLTCRTADWTTTTTGAIELVRKCGLPVRCDVWVPVRRQQQVLAHVGSQVHLLVQRVSTSSSRNLKRIHFHVNSTTTWPCTDVCSCPVHAQSASSYPKINCCSQ